MTETYESIRDSSDIVPRDVRVAWIEADQAERFLRGQYEQLTEDKDLNDEAKARRANELYEGRREAVERKKQAAKDALIKASKSAARSSIPRPSGESTSLTDPTKLLLDQNEANRIVRTIERRKGQGGPFSQNSGEYLAEEYERGLEVGGVEGGSICRGALRAAQELGLGDEWLPRNDRHRKLLDDSRRLEYFSELIDTKAPRPPRSLQKAARTSRERFAQRTPQAVMAPASGPPISATSSGHMEGGTSTGGESRTSKRPRRKKSWKYGFS